MAMNSLDQLFTHFLKDMYTAEKTILETLPKMAKKADSSELRKAFEEHEKQTKNHVKRLDQVFKLMDERVAGVPCKAIEGIVAEGKEIMNEAESADALDAGLIAAAQAVEHYEIARYGTMAAWAKELGMDEAAELLHETLEEEVETDEKLSELAEERINQEAA